MEREDMSTSYDGLVSDRLTATWEVELGCLTQARFAKLVVERGLEHATTTSWATERMTLEGVFAHALSTHRQHGNREALLDLGDELGGDCVVYLALSYGRAYIHGAARTVDMLSDLKAWLRERYPVSRPEERQEVHITFWTWSRYARRTSRTIAVPTWEEIAVNYPAVVAELLAGLMEKRFDEEHTGKLILWHGLPGTGKTYALRALAWAWRTWCSFQYITDPEAFFGEQPVYMLDVLLDEDEEASEWRVLILEDTGELLALDAKNQMGQGLSRLLNVVDGLIGQGLRVLVLVTTNEELRSLHPAVARPGRCVAKIEFGAFTADEADVWLERRGAHGDGSARTLAELFGGEEEVDQAKLPVGFSVR
jgi:hypothetical protein